MEPNKHTVQRLQFFQTAAEEHDSIFSISEIQVLIEKYLQRDNEELETLKAERRPGRPPSTREVLLKQKQAAEMGEYTSGFWVPAFEDAKNIQALKDWDGRWANLNTLKFVRVAKDGTRKESNFPPKGMS